MDASWRKGMDFESSCHERDGSLKLHHSHWTDVDAAFE